MVVFCYSCRLRFGTDLRFEPNLKKSGFEWVDGQVYLITYKSVLGLREATQPVQHSDVNCMSWDTPPFVLLYQMSLQRWSGGTEIGVSRFRGYLEKV
jgi:hypothetical protein